MSSSDTKIRTHGNASTPHAHERPVCKDGVGCDREAAPVVRDEVVIGAARPSVTNFPPRRIAGLIHYSGNIKLMTPNGREEEDVDRKQLAATSSDRKYFEAFKDDPNIEIRLALLDNPHFRDEAWFADFKTLYESYKRLRTIAQGAFGKAPLDSLNRGIDLKGVIDRFDELVPLVAKFEENSRIRYAVALNNSLTDDERALFANDSFLPIHRALKTKANVVNLYDSIKKIEEENAKVFNIGEHIQKKMDEWRASVGEKEYAAIMTDVYVARFSDEKIETSRLEGECLSRLPLTADIVDAVISTGKAEAVEAMMSDRDFVFSAEQVTKMYKLVFKKSQAKLIAQPNLPAEIAADYAARFKDDPAMLAALAKSPFVNDRYEQLASMKGMDEKALRLAVIENPSSSTETLKRAASAADSLGERENAGLLAHKNTPIEIRRKCAADVLAFRWLARGADNLDKIIEDVYLSDVFASEEKRENLRMVQDEMARYYMDEIYPSTEYFNFFSSRYAPREKLREAILAKPRDMFYAEVVAERRPDLTKEEFTALLKAIPRQMVGIVYSPSKLFEHPNLDSAMIIEACKHVERVRDNDYNAANLQKDFIMGYLEYHPADQRLRDYVIKKMKEEAGKDAFSYFASCFFGLSDGSLDLIKPGMPYAKEMREKLVWEVALVYFNLALYGGKKGPYWSKAHDITLALWEKARSKGIAGEIIEPLFSRCKDCNMRLVVAHTPGLDSKLYRESYEGAVKDYDRFKKEKDGVRSYDEGEHRAFLDVFWKNPSIPDDVLRTSEDSVETMDQLAVVSDLLAKRGLSDRDMLLKFRKKIKSYESAAKLAELMKKRGYDDPKLFLFAEIMEIVETSDSSKEASEKTKDIYDRDPAAFLAALEEFSSTPVVLDFLPDSYFRKYYHSFDKGQVQSLAREEMFFNEVYLADYNNPRLEKLMEDKSAFSRAFVLTMLPGLNLDGKCPAEMRELVARLETIRLFDNSFMEYYLVSQMQIVRDAFVNGFVSEEKKLPFLLEMVGDTRADVENYGKVSDGYFFKAGRRRLVTGLVQNSIFASRVKGGLSDDDIEKWEIFLHLGTRGLANMDEYEKMRRDVKVAGVFGMSLFGAYVDEDQEFPEHLHRDFFKSTYVASERIKQYGASVNPKMVERFGIQKDNAFQEGGTFSGDLSLVGGVSPYGANIEGVFYAELGHYYADHIYTIDQLRTKMRTGGLKMNPMSLFEFDDRTACSPVPMSLEDGERAAEVLGKYRKLDEAHMALAMVILDAYGENDRKKLLAACENVKPEQFKTRKDFYLFANAVRVLKNRIAGHDASPSERLILAEGMYTACRDGFAALPWGDAYHLIEKRKAEVEKLPFALRQAVEGGDFLSTYHNVYPMNGVPLMPVVSESWTKDGREDFSELNRYEQHLTAEWLVFYTKMRARALLAEGKIRPEDYFYFIKNMPIATKLLLAEKDDFDMSDVAGRIQGMTPETLGQLIERSGKPLSIDLDRDNRWIHRLDDKFRAKPDWTIADLEAEIARTRRLH